MSASLLRSGAFGDRMARPHSARCLLRPQRSSRWRPLGANDDIEKTAEGLRINIRHSKTDQEGRGEVIAIPRGSIARPVVALMTWIASASITEGAVFRPLTKGGRVLSARLTDRSVAEIIKSHAARVGLEPAQFSGHSLRSGFLTSAAARGASIFKLADQSRHKSMDVLRSYVRDAELFRNHAGDGLL
jgi:integrase